MFVMRLRIGFVLHFFVICSRSSIYWNDILCSRTSVLTRSELVRNFVTFYRWLETFVPLADVKKYLVTEIFWDNETKSLCIIVKLNFTLHNSVVYNYKNKLASRMFIIALLLLCIFSYERQEHFRGFCGGCL